MRRIARPETPDIIAATHNGHQFALSFLPHQSNEAVKVAEDWYYSQLIDCSAYHRLLDCIAGLDEMPLHRLGIGDNVRICFYPGNDPCIREGVILRHPKKTLKVYWRDSRPRIQILPLSAISWIVRL